MKLVFFFYLEIGTIHLSPLLIFSLSKQGHCANQGMVAEGRQSIVMGQSSQIWRVATRSRESTVAKAHKTLVEDRTMLVLNFEP